jgi:hypothetical protein
MSVPSFLYVILSNSEESYTLVMPLLQDSSLSLRMTVFLILY